MLTNKHWMVAALAASLLSTLAACGTEEEEVPDTDAGADTSSDGGGDTTPDTDVTGCEGPNPAGCNVEPCPVDLECLPTGDDGCMPSSCSCGDDGIWVCTEDCGEMVACQAPGLCDGPNPAGCAVLGCPDGQECVPTGAEGCAPSFCSCEPDSGWQCTADCGPIQACAPVEPEACPAEMPPTGGSCDVSSEVTCSWGMECCCGECFASEECRCDGGTWTCWATDACFIESCQGRACESEYDCEGGAIGAIACVDGFCRSEFFCDRYDNEADCNATGVCEYQVPGCASEPQITLDAPGCFPARQCTEDAECPPGSVCLPEVVVEPACARSTGGAVCDACGMTRSLCVRER